MGDDVLDSHHKEIFAIINRLFDQMRDGNISSAALQQTASDVIQYAEKHFHAEEEAMRQCGFTGLEHHQQVHREYIHETRTLAEQVPSDKDQADELLRYLKTWWLKHITTKDQAYAPYLKAKAGANKPDAGEA